MNQIEESKKYSEETFKDIKHLDKYGFDYWEARQLYPILGYRR